MAQISTYGGTKSKDKNKNKTTYTQTNTSDLSGTNRSQAYGNGAPKQRETGKTFTSSVSTNVKPKEVKSNATKYQSTLNSVSDSSNKKAQSLFSKNKVDTQPKRQTQKSEYDVDTSKFKYKQEYTREDRDRLDSELSTMLEQNPYANEDVMYKDLWSDEKKKGFAEQNQKIAEKAQEYNTAKTEVSLTKMGEDSQKNGEIRDEDVFDNVNGQVKAKDFSKNLKEASDYSESLQNEIKGLEDELSQYSPSVENAQIIGELNNKIRILRDELAENDKVVSNIKNKQLYQQSRIGKATLQYAKENNDVDLLNELGKQFDSYDDTFLERRLTNIAKIGVDMTTAVMNIADISIDLGGDALALASEKYAESLYKNGDIDDEQYNQFLTQAKRYANFEANDPTSASYAMRQLSNQLAYDIQNGEEGLQKFIGQGLDSTANFLVQFMGLGEMGSLVMMGTQSGTQKYFENLENGYSKTVSLLNGIATGVTSFMTEKIGMDNFTSLLTGTAGQKVYAQILDAIARNNHMEWEALARLWMSQGIAEGLEEVVEGNVDFVLDNLMAMIANGEPIEYNAGDLFYSMAVGGFSGLLMGAVATGGTAQFIVKTREQYNQLKADTDVAKRIYAESEARNRQANAEINSLMQGDSYFSPETQARISNLEEEVSANIQNMQSLKLAIASGESALANFSSQSQLMGVEYVNEMAEPRLDSRGETDTLIESVEPNVNSFFENEQKVQALEENIVRTASDFLAMRGVNMDASQFVELDESQRNYLLENAEKIQTACPNANVGYATYFEVPVIDDNGNVIGYRNAMEDSNAIVIKNEGGRPTIVVNPKGETSTIVSAVHEIIHTIEGTPEYNALFDFVFEGGISGQHFKDKYAELTGDRYAYTKKKGFEGYREAMKECLTCAVTEDMMRDEGAKAFIDHMAKYNTSTAYKLLYKFKEMTGLFKDNSALGRITAMLTEALNSQDVVYTPSGLAYSKIPSEQQMEELYKDPNNGLKDGNTELQPFSRSGRYQWMPSSEGDYDTVFGRETIKSLITGRPFGQHSEHNKASEQIIKNLDYLINNPIAVFPSKTQAGDYVVVLDARDELGNVILASVRPYQYTHMDSKYRDEEGKTVTGAVHVVTGVYGKDSWVTTNNATGKRNFAVVTENGKRKDGQKIFNDYFNGLGNPIYPEGMTHAEAKKLTEKLHLSPLGVNSISQTTGDYLRKSELLEKARSIDSSYEEKNPSDFMSFREANANPEYKDDWKQYDIDKVTKTGHTVVYATEPITDGVTVTPSLAEAQRWADGKRVYDKDIYTSNVLWKDSTSGIYEPVGDEYVKGIGDKITDLSKIVNPKDSSDEYRDGFIKDARDALRDYLNDIGDKFTWAKLQKNNGAKSVLDEIDRIAKSYPETYLDIENRTDIDNSVVDKFIDKEVEGKARDRKGVFYIGLPSAGKSTAGAREGKETLNAVEPDPDIIKELLPEYKEKGGIMANAVHEESSIIMKQLRGDIIDDGYNLVIPMIGDNYDKLVQYLDNLTSESYNLGIEFIDIPLDEAMKRMVKRFISTGRWVSPTILQKAGMKPKENYNRLKAEYKPKGNGRISFYEHIDNSGKTPVTVERIGDRDGFFETSGEGRNTQELEGNGGQKQGTSGSGNVSAGSVRNNDGRNDIQFSKQKVGEYSDEFTRIQEESQRVSRETSWGDASRYSDGNIQQRLSTVFEKELQSRNYSVRNADGLLKNTGDYKIFKDVDGQTFHDIFNIARTYLPYGELVDVHPVESTEDTAGYNDTKNYLASDGLSGFSITKDGDLISVFNLNRTKKGFLGSIAPFVSENAKTLDCYVLNNKVNLQQLYHDYFGFETKEVVDYDYQYDHDDIGKRYKEPKVAFMYNPKTTIEYSKKDLQTDVNNEGKELSAQQDQYFKNSWVRDTLGRLMVMYHGTFSIPFSIFNPSEATNGAFFFTSDPRVASAYVHEDNEEKATSTQIWAPTKEDKDAPSMRRRYAVYLDLKRPLIIDAKGKQWYDLELSRRFLNYKAQEYGFFKTVEDYNEFLDAFDDTFQNQWWDGRLNGKLEVRESNGKYLLGVTKKDGKWKKFSENIEAKSGDPNDLLRFVGNKSNYNFISKFYSEIANNFRDLVSDDVAVYAKKNGYDGVIFENMIDSEWEDIPSTVVVAFKPSQIKSINNLTPTIHPDIRYSKMSENTNVSTDEGLAKNAEAVEKYGAFDYGMNPARETDIAKRTDYGPTFQTVRTIANSMHVDDDFAKRMQSKTGMGGYVKEVQHDKDVIKKSADYIREHGFAKSYEHTIKANDLMNGQRDLTVGVLLMDEMENLGLRGTPEYEKLVDKIVQMGNAYGLGLRTVSLFKRMSPQGQVITIESEIRRIQEGLNDRYKDRAPKLQVPNELLKEYVDPKTSAERRNELREEIAKNIADQIPPTALEKLSAFRHLSMLFNPRTWVKNRLGNELFGYVNEMTRMLRTVGEAVYSQFDEDFEREAGIYNPLDTQDRAWYKQFVDDFNKNVSTKDGKYVSAIDAGDVLLDTEFGREISENRKQFSTKFMNWFVETNKNMLSDNPAKSKAYAKSMVGWFKAHNLTPETATPAQMEKAREFATKEALYATFNTENQLAKAIIQFERYGDKHFGKVGGKVNRMVVESFIPFKRTPLNLIKTGMSYTPLGLIKSVVYDGLIKVRNGDMNANQFINNMAQGLTGTGLFFLGALLKAMGIFRTKDDDKDRKKYFDKDNGEQDYSLVFDKFTYTLDWLDPMIVPLAMGAEFSKLIEDGDLSGDDIYKLGTAMAQPIFDTSMMSGITNNLKSYANDSSGYTTDIIGNAITNYASQYIPSVFGALARTLDDTRRTTGVSKGKLTKFAKKLQSKIPIASTYLEPYVDKSGKEQKNPTLGLDKYGKAGGFVGRALLNFLSAGYYADKEIDKYDEEMYRLYNETGEASVLPSSTSKSLTYDKKTLDFKDKEYTQWHKTRYGIESQFVNSFIDSSDYKSMSDEERVKTIESIRKYAQEVAKKEFLAGRGIEYDSKALKSAQGAINSGMDLYDYYNYKSSADKQEDKVKWMESNNLTDKEKQYLWELEGYKTSYEDVYKKVFGKQDKKKSKKKSSSTSTKKASSKTSKTKKTTGGGSSGTARQNLAVKFDNTVRPTVKQNKLPSNYLSAYRNTFSKPTQGGSKNTIVCPNCGNRVSSGTNVCPSCGAKL